MPGGDEIRDVQRATWAGLSAGWEKWDSVIMDELGPVGAAIIERLHVTDDQQHLDIAAGTGEPGLTVAKLAPRGHVVLTDLAAEMLDIATRRANAQGITNFETKVCSADALPFGDATFDSISVRFGYMFFFPTSPKRPGVADIGSRATSPGSQPFVRVHGHRVGVSNRSEGGAQRGRRSSDQPVGAVDVEPGAVLRWSYRSRSARLLVRDRRAETRRSVHWRARAAWPR